MLVENKFYFISLPRCASTSFMISCIKNKLKINHENSKLDAQIDNIENWETISNERLADELRHNHESLFDLEKKFGKNYPIITIKRNRHERFISLWKHIIDEMYRTDDIKTFEIIKTLTVDDILFYKSKDVATISNCEKTTKTFLEKHNLINSSQYFKNVIISILLPPYSIYHHHDNRIKWFDIDKLYELENWVSNILNKPFKLEKINSSQHFECGLKLNDDFIEKYNKIYDIHDFKKEIKTII